MSVESKLNGHATDWAVRAILILALGWFINELTYMRSRISLLEKKQETIAVTRFTASEGREMTIRGGIADILDVLPDGRMLMVYSGGLHHIQVPGELLPTPFKTLRCRMEMIEIPSYKEELKRDYPDLSFRRAVIADLTRRRDEYCPQTD